jgi:hypothetical protein
MARTVAHKLGTDSKFQAAFLMIGIAIAIPVGIVTKNVAAASVVVSVFVLLLGLARYREERLARSLASPGSAESDSN